MLFHIHVCLPNCNPSVKNTHVEKSPEPFADCWKSLEHSTYGNKRGFEAGFDKTDMSILVPQKVPFHSSDQLEVQPEPTVLHSSSLEVGVN